MSTTYSSAILVWDSTAGASRVQKIGATDLLTLGAGSGGGLVLGGSSLTLGSKLTVTGAADISDTLVVTGTVTGATGSIFGDLTLANGSITTSGNQISFGSENLVTSGTLGAGVSTLTSAALGGASIGSHGLAVDGTASISTTLSARDGDMTNSLKVNAHLLGNSNVFGVIGAAAIQDGTFSVEDTAGGAEFTVTKEGAVLGATLGVGGALGGAGEVLTVTGAAVITTALDVGTTVTVGVGNDMVIGVGSITSASGTITFVDENLGTTGTLGAGVSTLTSAALGGATIGTHGLAVTGTAHISSNLEVNGNLNIAGDIISSGTVDHVTTDRWMEYGVNPSTVQQSGGFALCMESAAAVTQTASVFVAGSSSGPTITCSASVSGVAANNIITISGTDKNDGTYVVASVSGANIVIRGTGGSALPVNCPFAQNQFVAETGATGAIVVVESIAALGFSAGAIPKTGGTIAAGGMCTMYWRGTGGAGFLIDASSAVWEVSGVTSLQDAYDAGNSISLSNSSGALTVLGYSAVGDITFGGQSSNQMGTFEIGATNLVIDTSAVCEIDTVGATTWTATSDWICTSSAGDVGLISNSTDSSDATTLKSGNSGYVQLTNTGWGSGSPSIYIAGRLNSGFNRVFKQWTATETLVQGDVAISCGYEKAIHIAVEASGGASANDAMKISADYVELGVPLHLTKIASNNSTGLPRTTHVVPMMVFNNSNALVAGQPLEIIGVSYDFGPGAAIYMFAVPITSSSSRIDAILLEAMSSSAAPAGQDCFPCMSGAACGMPVSTTYGGTAVAANTTLALTAGANGYVYMDTTGSRVQLSLVAPTSGDVFLAGKVLSNTTDGNALVPISWIGQEVISL